MTEPSDETGIAVQAAWFALLVDAGYPAVAGPGGSFAVRSGQPSNTENGCVLTRAVTHDALDVLLRHAADGGAPASAILGEPSAADPLVARGWRPDVGAHEMVGPLVVPERPAPCGVVVTEVVDETGLRAHVEGFGRDWYEDEAEADQAVEHARRLGFGPGHPVRRWVVLADGRPAGAATSFLVPGTDVVSLAAAHVAGPYRRRGIGTALTAARLQAARADGARTVHVSPSPDGAALHGALGLRARPVPPHRWFYSPVEHT